MMEIGDIEIPIVGMLEPTASAEFEEIEPIHGIDHVGMKHEHEPEEIIVSAFLNEITHSQSLSLEEQQDEVRKLRGRSIDENTVDFEGFSGHLLINDVNFTDNLDSKIVNSVEITARLLPWPKFYPEDEP